MYSVSLHIMVRGLASGSHAGSGFHSTERQERKTRFIDPWHRIERSSVRSGTDAVDFIGVEFREMALSVPELVMLDRIDELRVAPTYADTLDDKLGPFVWIIQPEILLLNF